MPMPPLPACPPPRQPLLRRAPAAAALLASALLAACGGGGGGGMVFFPPVATPPPPPPPPPERGTLVEPAQRTATLTAAQFKDVANNASPSLLLVAGEPKCGFELHALHYHTEGGHGEPTTGGGGLMVPTGTDPACSGPRPVVVYAHGTTFARDYDLGRWTTPGQAAAGEGLMTAAMFAAQGYIVVAPNYAGYAQSTLAYHPYLNRTQQARDVIDALTAARSVLPVAGAADDGRLFVTGYSQGGYVALATHREMQAQGMAVTASAPLAAPSAISLLIDYSTLGWPALGSTLFMPMITTSWQQQSGDVYGSLGDIYEAQYATGIDTLLPSLTPVAQLFADGKLPQAALYPADAVPGPLSSALSAFYGPNNLVKQSFLTASATDIVANGCPGNALPATEASLVNANPLDCEPQQGMRRAAKANDLRDWLPQRPVFFCAGDQDPTVNFISTQATAGYFAARGMPADMLQVLNLEEASPGEGDPWADARIGLQQAKSQLYASTPGTPTEKALAVTLAYHGALVPPFCLASARGFFQAVAAAGSPS